LVGLSGVWGSVSNPREIKEIPERLYVVGDIHGCLDELRLIIEFLLEERHLCQKDLVVFCGDYIDRGYNARGVVQYLIDFKEKFPDTVFLKGNHEEMLLAYLSSEHSILKNSYLANGGMQTLESYNMPNDEFSLPEEEERKLIQTHLNFFTALEPCVMIGDFVVVHAGLNPLRALDAQIEEDMLWIRDEFILSPHYFNKTVVFGHTPYHDVYLDLPSKIGVDTGLVYGNMLTCIELFGHEVIQINLGGTTVFTGSFNEDGVVSAPISEEPSKKSIKKKNRKRKVKTKTPVKRTVSKKGKKAPPAAK
jgi:serine/threonine protein phosphatase 1